MTETRTPLHTGGCQCGAVRYALYAAPQGPHICHCRMCQKAFGSYFAPLAGMDVADLGWTRGAPKAFHSSEAVARGFCAECGTPLTLRDFLEDKVFVSLGSLDRPMDVVPAHQYGIESRVPFFGALAGLPAAPTGAGYGQPRYRSRQHPDHDPPN